MRSENDLGDRNHFRPGLRSTEMLSVPARENGTSIFGSEHALSVSASFDPPIYHHFDDHIDSTSFAFWDQMGLSNNSCVPITETSVPTCGESSILISHTRLQSLALPHLGPPTSTRMRIA